MNEIDDEILCKTEEVKSAMLYTSFSITSDEVVEVNKLSKTGVPKYHSISNHNFWVSRHKRCVYCDLGSEPLEDSLLYDLLAKK